MLSISLCKRCFCLKALYLLLGFVLVVVISARAQATPIGTFDESIHQNVTITFQFPASAGGPPYELYLGIGGSLQPPSPGLSGCEFQLSDGSGVISSSTISSALGCSGNWTSDDNSADSLNIDSNVDLSGIAAGEIGTIVMRPTFLGPGGVFNMDMPVLYFNGFLQGTVLSQTINSIPEPASAWLLTLAVLVWPCTRRKPATCYGETGQRTFVILRPAPRETPNTL